jgi:hypothetical protein
VTRVLVDAVETQQDVLRFGDPVGCHYHWLDPDQVDAYGDSVRRLGARVELAVDAFDRTASLSEDVFSGEAADALRTRAAHRHDESAAVRDDLRGLGRAINDYSEALRRHREGLEQLRAYAVSAGLEVRDHRIWPPVETLAADAPQKEVDAWEHAWKAYRQCFDTQGELRDARRASTRDLVRALADFAGVHPDHDRATSVASGGRHVDFGDLRRDAADEAMQAVDAQDAADSARHTVAALERREQTALGDLEELVLADRPPEDIQAQADKVAAVHRELVEARAEARDADAFADREQAQADRAVRTLADAEAGRPRIVAQPTAPAAEHDAPADLDERLG